MIKGTTPTHIFTLPIDTSLLAEIRIVYAQNGEKKLIKDLSMCKVETKQVSVLLTQEETLKFNDACFVDIQVRAKTLGGEVFASDIIKIPVCKCLETEVI